MQFSLYQWVYLTTNIFLVYTIYKLMKVFFDVNRTSKKIERLSYITYGALITITYFTVNIPAVLILFNIVAFFFLTFNYEATIKKRVLSALLTYLILLLIEFIGILPFESSAFSPLKENASVSIYGLIVCRLLSFVAALILGNFKNIRKGESVPNSNWLCIILIPMASLYLHLLLFYAEGLHSGHIFAGVVLLFLINFAAFYLYDAITAAMSEKMQSMLALEQNKYYEKQFELIKTAVQTTSTIRHDLKNHMFSIQTLTEEGKNGAVLDYIENIMEDLGAKQNLATSGNTVIDSIINFKFQDAEQRGIRTTLELRIPDDSIGIPSFDLTIILGNLLDNAIEAAARVGENRYLNVKIRLDKGRLLIQVENPYKGEIKGSNGKLLTTKADNENHGIGLDSIKKTIQKYDGTMDIHYADNIFCVSLLLYVN
ncbi:GHKL domain-containing protein [Anoxybacterium hadale]|uniref:GHKL domain-containing protein n=1 Tax=Anoxybacterium hadale TaxID=3408580 RepID=A0ACD1AA61_9FIRM|nr:GHKL domain-containing protein [Clostridiales bacterium]